jgi:hypothetical protein
MLIASTNNLKVITRADQILGVSRVPYDIFRVRHKWFIGSEKPEKAKKVLIESGLVKVKNPSGYFYPSKETKWSPLCPKCKTPAWINEENANFKCPKCRYEFHTEVSRPRHNPKMKMKPEHYEWLKKCVNIFFKKNKDWSYQGHTNTMSERWSIFWDINDTIADMSGLYKYYNDDHIDTALKHAIDEHLSRKNPILETIIGGLASGASLGVGFLGAKTFIEKKWGKVKNPIYYKGLYRARKSKDPFLVVTEDPIGAKRFKIESEAKEYVLRLDPKYARIYEENEYSILLWVYENGILKSSERNPMKKWGKVKNPINVKIGDWVVASNKEDRYYSGEGKVVAIERLKTKKIPTSRTIIKDMIAVHFSGKGTIWFLPNEVKLLNNPAPAGFWGGRPRSYWKGSAVETRAEKERKAEPEEKESWADFLGTKKHRRHIGSRRGYIH